MTSQVVRVIVGIVVGSLVGLALVYGMELLCELTGLDRIRWVGLLLLAAVPAGASATASAGIVRGFRSLRPMSWLILLAMVLGGALATYLYSLMGLMGPDAYRVVFWSGPALAATVSAVGCVVMRSG